MYGGQEEGSEEEGGQEEGGQEGEEEGGQEEEVAPGRSLACRAVDCARRPGRF